MPPRGRSTKQLTDEQIAQAEEDRKNAPAEDVTTFEEDDDPRQFVGELAEDDEEVQD